MPHLCGIRGYYFRSIKSIARENKYPWLCVGDFNGVSSQADKQGGNPCGRGRLDSFHRMMTECEFMDLKFKGPNYTWSNNQKGGNNIRIRLDRSMANVDWRHLFPIAQVVHELRLESGV